MQVIGYQNYDIKSFQDNKILFGKIINHPTTLNKLLPLIKGYLIVGGIVSKNYYIDRKFETINNCVIMLIDKIVNRYNNKFLN